MRDPRRLRRILFVTSNPGKAREAAALMGRELEAAALDLPEIQSLDFVEVAREKAREAARRLGEAALVEDSGLSVDAWGGFPGPLTKWLTGGTPGPAGLARMLDAFPDRRAAAVSVLALCFEGGILVAEGRVRGTIAPAPRGTSGFGWDPIFVPDGEERTWGEMSPEEKNRDSHRARAFRELRRLLDSQA